MECTDRQYGILQDGSKAMIQKENICERTNTIHKPLIGVINPDDPINLGLIYANSMNKNLSDYFAPVVMDQEVDHQNNML